MENVDPVTQRFIEFFTSPEAEFFTSERDGIKVPSKRRVNSIKRTIADTHDIYIQLSMDDGICLITKDKYNQTVVSSEPVSLSQRDAQLISTILTALEKWNARD